jgi:branched-chain amino acid transport system ATP-binding protein
VLLEVTDLVVRYGPIVAVQGASLTVEEGEMVALLGPNGAGKSSFLSALVGFVKPAQGHVRIRGQEVTGRPTEELVLRHGITLVPEGRRMFPRLTVGQNLRLGGVAQADRESYRRALERTLELFPVLRTMLQRPAATLSGGQQQMAAIARALMASPRILLLDEPSLGLAPLAVEQVFRLLDGLRDQGITILLVEQNARRALQLADRAYILAGGLIRHQGAARDLLHSSDVERAYMGAGLE